MRTLYSVFLSGSLVLLILGSGNASAAGPADSGKPQAAEAAAGPNVIEPIPYFERYKPTFFLVGTPITKVQLSFKVEILDKIPFYFGYSQLMMWELFKSSAPFRDINYNPELFYRFKINSSRIKTLDFGVEHESNGKGDPESRSWNRAYARYYEQKSWKDRSIFWSIKAWVPTGMDDDESRALPKRRGLYEFQIGINDFFGKVFAVNELFLRVYGGGSSRLNPFQGGQELTYREKEGSHIFLLPLYVQIFHGYGENMLDAGVKRWGFRAGVGF